MEDYQFADEYVQALDEGRAHECSGEAGRHVLEILMGIFESGARGRRVDLPQADRDHPLLRWREEHGYGSAQFHATPVCGVARRGRLPLGPERALAGELSQQAPTADGGRDDQYHG